MYIRDVSSFKGVVFADDMPVDIELGGRGRQWAQAARCHLMELERHFFGRYGLVVDVSATIPMEWLLNQSIISHG